MIHIKGMLTNIKYNNGELALKSDIPSSYVSSVNGDSGAITKVLKQSSTTTTANKVMLSSTTQNQGEWSNSSKGSATKPVYLNSNGVLSECNNYAGGTSITLNDTSKAGEAVSFYAPTAVGGAQRVLQSNGYASPSWVEVYPVGSVYLSTVQTSPAQFFGGSWTALSGGYALWTTTTANTGGGTISAGLPNITGSRHLAWNDSSGGGIIMNSTENSSSSALYATKVGSSAWFSQQVVVSNSSNYLNQLSFNASRSNSIYGNSTTVQPPAIKVYAWKRTA